MAGIATGRDFVGRATHADGVVRELGPRSEADIPGLLRCAGQSGHPNRFIPALVQAPPPPVAWTAGLFVANELRGVVYVGDASREKYVEARLFVDAGWRRQGIGSMLVKEAMNWGRRRDARALRLVCERTDWPMRHFAEKCGARLDLVFGQIVADFPLSS